MTSTLLTRTEITEPEWASLLEDRFGASWFPEHHRCSVESVEGTVFVDFEAGYSDTLAPDERRVFAARLGFIPAAAIHVQPSKLYSGSAELAARVFATLSLHLHGTTALAAA